MDGEEPQCDDGHASGIPINTDDDIPLQIPDFARAWDPSVRRPIQLPDPKEYHSVIDPRSIFELDLDSDSGVTKSILVVPGRCTFCARINQACSRLRPTCARCSKAGRKCAVVHAGWDNLPPPKRSKRKAEPRFAAAAEPLTWKTPEGEPRSKLMIQVPTRHIQPEQNPITKKLLRPKKSQANMARLGFTKTAKAKTLSELPFKKRRPKGATDTTRIASGSQNTLQPKDGSDESPIAPSEPEWSFIKSSASKVEEQRRDGIRLPGSRPRVWINSRANLLAIFPDLGKSDTGFTWLQSETPTLLLERSQPEDSWSPNGTIELTLTWNFSCREQDLEDKVVLYNHPPEPIPQFPKGDISSKVSNPDERTSDLPVLLCTCTRMRFGKHHRHCGPEPHPTVTAASTGLEDSPILKGHQVPGMPPVVPRVATVQPLPPGGPSITRYSPLPPAPATPGDNNSTASAHADTPVPPPLVLRPSKPTQRFPEKKPLEIRVLLDSQAKKIPLLVILSRECALMPFDLPPEYAYSYLGLFFISDIRAELADFSETLGTDVVRGRVRWRLMLEWAPGGEKALFTRADDRTRPWWVSKSPDTGSSESDSTLSRYRPRDLNDHYYSFLPLDLLAKFTPSENFPRGWWCRNCGLVNAQRYFRHQICGSSSCKALSDDSKYKGLADSLHALRDPHHTLPLLMPQDSAPPEVPTVVSSWEDSMRTIVYEVNENAAVKHIFTGNQEGPQEEPTQLLQAIQQDVLILRREYSSPYFTHLTTAAALCDVEAISWFGAPPCIVQARDLMLHYAHVYAETDGADINEVLTQAWVTAGSKKGRVFRARDSPIILLSLGAEVTLNIVPKGGFGEPHDNEIDAIPRQAPSRNGPPPISTRPALRPTESSQNQERNDLRLPSPVFAAYAHNDLERYAHPERPPDPDGEMDMEISDDDETVADPEPWSCMTVDPPLEPMHPTLHIADALPNHDADDLFFPLATTAASAHRDLQHIASSQHRVASEGGLHMDITYGEARIDPEPLSRSPTSSGDAAIVLMEHTAPITSTSITAGEAPSQSASFGEAIATISTGGLLSLSWPLDATTLDVQMSEDDLGGSGLAGADVDLVDHSTLRGSTTEFAYPISGLSATTMGTRQSDSRELTFHAFKDADMGDGGAVPELTFTGARLIEPSTTLNQFITDIQPETASNSVLPGTAKFPPHGISPSPIATKGRGEKIVGVRTRGRAKRKAQQTAPELSVTLVHGDGLLLMGDDFECQIKRTGTTILLVGCSVAT